MNYSCQNAIFAETDQIVFSGEIWRQHHDKFHIPWKTER